MSRQMSSRPQMTPFNQFVGEEDHTEPAPSLHSPSSKETFTSPMGASSFCTQCISRLRAMGTIAKTKKDVSGVRKFMKKKQTAMVDDDDVEGGFAYGLDSYISSGLGAEFCVVYTDELDEK